MSIRTLNILAVLVTLLVAIAVQLAKSDVHEQKERLADLAKEIREHREAIRVLNAEWALLSSPDLLQQRSHQFLALMPIRSGQIVDSPNAIPMRPKGADAADDEGVVLPFQPSLSPFVGDDEALDEGPVAREDGA